MYNEQETPESAQTMDSTAVGNPLHVEYVLEPPISKFQEKYYSLEPDMANGYCRPVSIDGDPTGEYTGSFPYASPTSQQTPWSASTRSSGRNDPTECCIWALAIVRT